jgi:hypothetical protein
MPRPKHVLGWNPGRLPAQIFLKHIAHTLRMGPIDGEGEIYRRKNMGGELGTRTCARSAASRGVRWRVGLRRSRLGPMTHAINRASVHVAARHMGGHTTSACNDAKCDKSFGINKLPIINPYVNRHNTLKPNALASLK